MRFSFFSPCRYTNILISCSLDFVWEVVLRRLPACSNSAAASCIAHKQLHLAKGNLHFPYCSATPFLSDKKQTSPVWEKNRTLNKQVAVLLNQTFGRWNWRLTIGKTIFLTYRSQHCRKWLYIYTVTSMSMKVSGLRWLILGLWPTWVLLIIQNCKDHSCNASTHLCIQHIGRWILTLRVNLTFWSPNLWESALCPPFQIKPCELMLKFRPGNMTNTTSSPL